MNAGGVSRLVQPQEHIITTKSAENAVVKRYGLIPPLPPLNVTMALIFFHKDLNLDKPPYYTEVKILGFIYKLYNNSSQVFFLSYMCNNFIINNSCR